VSSDLNLEGQTYSTTRF